MFSLFNWSIRYSIIVIVLLAILPVAVIMLYSGYSRGQEEKLEEQHHLSRIINSLGEQEMLRLENGRDIMLTMAISGIFSNPDPAAISSSLKSLVKNGDFIDIKLVSANGEIITSASGSQQLLPPEKKLAEAATYQGRFTTGDFLPQGDDNPPGIYFSLPLGAYAQENMTLVASSPLYFKLPAVGSDISPFAQIRYVDRSGRYIADNNGERSDIEFIEASELSLLRNFEADSGHYSLAMQNKEHLVVFERLSLQAEDPPPFYILLDVPQSELSSDSWKALLRDLRLLFFGAFFSLLIAWFLSSRVLLHPLKLLIGIASRFGHGELGARTEINKFQGEFKSLAHSFNHMAVALEIRNQQLTESKKAADAGNKAKSAFLANMSHEIRTPMNAIIGLAYLALQSNLPPKQYGYIKKIYNSANSLLRIINDILDFSKVEAGKLKLEETPFELDEIFDNIANMLIPQARKKGVEIEFAINRHVPAVLKGDPLRLGQILINLLSNAIKFTNRGKITLTCSIKEFKDGFCRIVFSVKDTGIGMSEDTQKKLFKAFSQADDSTTRKFGGTGLGLVISKHLAEMMGGDIFIKSVEGEGTTVDVEVRLGLADEASRRYSESHGGLNGLPVLLVDDDENSRTIMIEMLKRMGVRPKTATSGEEAVSEIESMNLENPYKVVLMDWKLPGINGSEATKRIKELNLPHVPVVIMITAYGRGEIMHYANSSGVDAFLHKPVSPSILYNTIQDSLLGASSSEAGASSPGHTANPSFAGARILLVEDNIINQQVANELLSSTGAEVDIAEDGQQALNILAETKSGTREPYNLVLMDLQMPVMDGLEATHNIRADSYFDNLPIIAMTAHTMHDELKDCLDAKMNDHISKPIDVQTLYSTVSQWLGKGEAAASGVSTQPDEEDSTQAKEAWRDGRWSSEDISSQKDAPGSSVADLPSLLPAFAVDQALKRVAGNAALYQKLLTRFSQEYANTPEELRNLISSDKIEDAILLTHTIKGLAGNLGMTELFEAAKTLEDFLRSDQDLASEDTENKFNAFSVSLNQSISQVNSALKILISQAEAPGVEEISAENSCKHTLDPDKLNALKDALRESGAESQEIFREIESDLQACLPEGRLSILRDNIDNFEFDEAYQLLLALLP